MELPRFFGHFTALTSRDCKLFLQMSLFELGRARVPQRRVQSLTVVEDLDELENRGLQHPPGGPAPLVQELGLQRGKKALRNGIVERIAHRAHGAPDPGFPAAAG